MKEPKPSVRQSRDELLKKGMKRKTLLLSIETSIKLEVEAAKTQVTEGHVVSALIDENL